MEKLRILSVAVLTGSLLLGACSADKSVSQGGVSAGEELVFSSAPEPADGRLDVYQSMARAVKYNVDAASSNLSKKIYAQNPALSSRQMLDSVVISDVNDNSKLFDASRALEFAVIYAMAHLNNNQVFADNYFYNKSSQHLALAAIRLHQDTWFATRKIKEFDREIRLNQKIVQELNQKLERQGTLAANDLNYKKNLEVALLKMGEMRQALAANPAEYSLLEKVEPQKVELEGRRFYELEDFDGTYKLDIFQEAAVRNRTEFAIAKEQIGGYSFDGVRRKILTAYPLVDRLDINGLTIENEVYNKELKDKAYRVAENLLDAVRVYDECKAGSAAKETARKKAYDELGAAILTQVEVSYRLVEQADIDYQNAESEIGNLKKSLRQKEKAHRLSNEQKLEILNDKIALKDLERKATQISAERAVALRSLYFNAGLSPFGKTMLKAPIKDITAVLKTSFNRDLIEMLAAALQQIKKQPADLNKGWAQKDNWLEEIVKESPRRPAAKTTVSARANSAQTRGTIQLGAYSYYESAEADWKKLGAEIPELKIYTPEITQEGGFYRLLIKAPAEVCNGVKKRGGDCLVR